MAKLIKESADTGALTGSRMEITLITPGWGTSGYYSAPMLEQAAADKVFPRGTQQHIDHLGESERFEKPAGSVATLAAALDEDARWEPDWVDPKTGTKGRLVAESRVFSNWRAPLADMAEFIGVSIAAAAEVSMGEAEGRKGRIVEALVPGALNRVDFVTVAGRGGQITEVLEAARVEEARNIGAWLEARMHSMFTNISDEMYGEGRLTREERITLSGALGEALQAFTARIEADAAQLFERDLWEEPAPTTAAEAAKDSPSAPAGVTENEKEPIVATIQIEESEHANLIAQSSRTTALEAEVSTATTRATTAEAGLTEANDTAAAAVVEAAFSAVGISAPKTAARLAKGYPVKENGVLNTEALAASVAESIAELQVANGAGTVRGVGHTATATESAEPADSDILAELHGGK